MKKSKTLLLVALLLVAGLFVTACDNKEKNDVHPIPKFDSSVDRFKDTPAYVFGNNDDNEEDLI